MWWAKCGYTAFVLPAHEHFLMFVPIHVCVGEENPEISPEAINYNPNNVTIVSLLIRKIG